MATVEKRKVTIADIARACDVSKMTVSNVLNGHVDRVSAATRERVLEAATKLDYYPSAAAKALSGAKSDIISLVYYDTPDGSLGLSSPHDAMMVGEIERHVSAAGKHLMVHAAVDAGNTGRRMQSWNVDGAIFLGVLSDDVEQLRQRRDVPMVFVDSYTETDVSTVGLDDEVGSYLATKHLIQKGHRELVFISPDASSDGVLMSRYRGFLRALEEVGIEGGGARIYANLSVEGAETAADALLAEGLKFTGAVVTADVLAIGLMRALERRGVHVPADLSVVGFDDLPISRMVTPELTTVRQDIAEKARVAVQTLLEQLDGGTERRNIRLVPTLVERGSVAAPARRYEDVAE